MGSEADATRMALDETLRTQEVLFEFQVQPRTTERTMPIEDASVEWPVNESPYRTVAHLSLPRQEIELLGSKMPTGTFRSTFGIRSPHIGPWVASIPVELIAVRSPLMARMWSVD